MHGFWHVQRGRFQRFGCSILPALVLLQNLEGCVWGSLRCQLRVFENRPECRGRTVAERRETSQY